MSAPENPPAFPQFGMAFGEDPYIRDGMTLRDWFAGQWLSGMLGGNAKFESPETIAEEAYGVADAMLAERERTSC